MKKNDHKRCAQESILGAGVHNRHEAKLKNTMLCIDLKTFLRKDSILVKGRFYHGDITQDAHDHVTFIESAPGAPRRRNPRVFDGKYITMTYRSRDHYARLNFKDWHLGAHFDINAYAVGVMDEIRQALGGFLGK